MKTGRPPKPVPLKVLQGTDRPDRRKGKNIPTQVETGPRAPQWLSREAVEIFGTLKARLEPLGLSSETYTEQLAMLAYNIERVQYFSKFLADNGETYETTTAQGDTMIRPRPQVSMLGEAMKKAMAGCSLFGLDPSNIQRVSAAGVVEGKQNSFAGL